MRILSENSTENLSETEILPSEKDIDIQLRQIEKNKDNSNNITLVSYEDLYSEKAKLTGSLDNKEVYTNINNEGLVSSIYESQNTEMISNVKDEAQDKYIKDTAYTNTTFDEEIFKIENETELQDNISIKVKSMNANNTNLVNLMDDLSDDNGTLIEYLSSIEYEIFNDSVYENYLLKEMGTEYLDNLNSSNLSITEENYEDNTSSLRELLSFSDYPYYGQDITRNIKDVYTKEILGITIKKYIETSIYPHNGKTTIENIFIFGSLKKSLSKRSINTNNHILIKNKNSMTNQFVIYLSNINLKDEQFKNNINEIYNNYTRNINDLGMEFNSLYKAFDWFKLKFEDPRDELLKELKGRSYGLEHTISSLDNTCDELYDQITKHLYDIKDNYSNKISALYLSWKSFTEKAKEKIISPDIGYDDLLIVYEICDDLESKYSEIRKQFLEILEQSNYYFNDFIYNFFVGIIFDNNFYEKEFKIKGKNIIEAIEEIEIRSYGNLDYFTTDTLSKWKQYFAGSQVSSFISKINNITKEDFYIDIEDELNNLGKCLETNIYKPKEEKINELNENRPSYISGIDSMKADLDYVYDKMNHDFFDFYKNISDELYSRLQNFKFSLFDDIVEIKNKLSNYSNSMFKYMNISVDDLDNNNIDSIKENLTLILEDYNKTLSNYLYGMNDYILGKNFSLFNFDVYIDKMENNLQEFIKRMNISTNNYLEPPNNLLDALEFYFIQLNKTYQKMEDFTSNFEGIVMGYFFIEILASFQENLLIFVTRDFEGPLSLINNKTSIFYSETMANERELFNNIYEVSKKNAVSIIINNFSRMYNTESIHENFYGFNSLLNRLKSLGKYSEMKDSLKEKINNTYNPNNAIIYQNESEKIEYLINYNFIKTLMNYTNSFAENLNNILNDEDKKDFLISDKELDYVVEFCDKNKIEKIKESISNYNYQEKSNSIYDFLDIKIKPFLDSYELNYSEIATEYTKIIEWNDNTFIDYFTNYLNGIVDSIYSLIDEYSENLYSSLQYPYYFENSGFQEIKNYFENLTDDIINEFTFPTEEFERNFRDRNLELLRERRYDFNSILGSYYYENIFDVEIGENKFNTLHYIIDKMEEIDDLNNDYEFIEIFYSNLTQFKNELEKIYKNHSQIISEKLSEETKNFLNSFEKNKSNDFLTRMKILSASNIKKNYKSCYDIRGLFLSQITVLDEKNLQAYKSYNYTMSIIEERCKVNGVLDEENCIYDLSDIEPVEYKELRPIYDECMNIGINIHYLGYSYFESSEDFDLSTITSILNKIKKKLKKYISFEKIITDYIFNKYNINWYKKNKINFNLRELTELIKFKNNKIATNYNEFLREKFLSLLLDIYGEYKHYKFDKVKYKDLLLLSQLKKTFYLTNYINGYGYKEHKNYYLEILPKIKSLDPFLKEKLSNISNEVDAKQNSFFQNWEENINSYISHYYDVDKLNTKILNHFFRILKNNFIDEWNMSYIQENFDIIINDTSFNLTLIKNIKFDRIWKI